MNSNTSLQKSKRQQFFLRQQKGDTDSMSANILHVVLHMGERASRLD